MKTGKHNPNYKKDFSDLMKKSYIISRDVDELYPAIEGIVVESY